MSNVTDMSEIFDNTALSTANYDATLISWAEQSIQPDVPIGALNITFCAGEDARNTLISDSGWVFTGDSKSCNPDTDFVSFSFVEQLAPATINTSNHSISINVADGTILTELVATFELSPGATALIGDIPQVSESTANDFSAPVTYFVSAQDGVTTQNWVVTVFLGEQIATTETVEHNSAQINYSAGSRDTNYRILAIPFASRTVNNTFEEFLPIDATRWRLVSYNSSANSYSNVTGSLSPGTGYFFLASEQVTLEIGGDGFSLTNETLPKPLSEGYNLIGNPFTGTLNWDEVINYNLTQGNILVDDVGGLVSYSAGFGNRSSLSAYEGAFVMATSSLPNFVIPLSAANVDGRINQRKENKPKTVDIGTDDWELSFYLDSKELGYDIAAFGFNENAAEGADKYDYPHIPQFEKYLKIDFGQENSRDFKPGETFKSWTFTIPNNLEDKYFKLEWDRPVSDQYTVMLYDSQAGNLYDLKEKEKISIKNDPGAEHQLLFGTPEEIYQCLGLKETVLVSLYPNPTREVLNIEMVSPHEGDARISLVGLSGKTIYRSNHQLLTGINKIEIAVNEDFIPDGIYLLHMEGEGFSITSKFVKR